MKRRVAISGGRDTVADFVQGGGQIDPPPPVKIGLTHSERRPPNIYSLEGNTSISSSNWQHKFLYFHYKSVKLDVLFRHEI